MNPEVMALNSCPFLAHEKLKLLEMGRTSPETLKGLLFLVSSVVLQHFRASCGIPWKIQASCDIPWRVQASWQISLVSEGEGLGGAAAPCINQAFIREM